MNAGAVPSGIAGSKRATSGVRSVTSVQCRTLPAASGGDALWRDSGRDAERQCGVTLHVTSSRPSSNASTCSSRVPRASLAIFKSYATCRFSTVNHVRDPYQGHVDRARVPRAKFKSSSRSSRRYTPDESREGRSSRWHLYMETRFLTDACLPSSPTSEEPPERVTTSSDNQLRASFEHRTRPAVTPPRASLA